MGFLRVLWLPPTVQTHGCWVKKDSKVAEVMCVNVSVLALR